MDERDKILLIEKLITDEDFDKLKDYFKDINIFKVTGIGKWEIKHSNILAWFFNPLGNHNLGALFFQKFMSQLFEKNLDYFNDREINILQLLINDVDDIKVSREKYKIDILIVSRINENEFVICIENKIDADIGEEQLNDYYDVITNQYPKSKRIFLLLSPSGYKVSADKSENHEEWISASYEDIVKILSSILRLDIEQKVKYIIGDYIKLLEERQIVDNINLDDILSSLFAKHKDAIDLLLEYSKKSEESQPVSRVQGIFKEVLLEYEKEKKIACIKDAATLSFNTTNMNKYFPPVQDKSGSWRDGQKYKYWVQLRDGPDKVRIYLQTNPLGQDDDIKRKMILLRNEINPNKKTWTPEYNKIKDWYIDINWTDDSLEDLNKDERVQDIKAEIRKTLGEILDWEKTKVKNILE